MPAQIINGKEQAEIFYQDLARQINNLTSSKKPHLAVILAGDDEASHIYVRNKKNSALKVGIDCDVLLYSASVDETTLLNKINELNQNPDINGIIVQLPLPQHLDSLKILSAIDYNKDVDGFSPYNAGLLTYQNSSAFISATPKGVFKLLQSTNIDLRGKHAVVIGRSNIVGKPMAMLLLNHDCTVTVTHRHTKNLKDLTRLADILISACGQAKMIKADWVKKGAVVIDVGINRIDGKLCGDVDFEEVKEKASFITPVPKGVGPMTIAMLLANTFEAYLRQNNL